MIYNNEKKTVLLFFIIVLILLSYNCIIILLILVTVSLKPKTLPVRHDSAPIYDPSLLVSFGEVISSFSSSVANTHEYLLTGPKMKTSFKLSHKLGISPRKRTLRRRKGPEMFDIASGLDFK